RGAQPVARSPVFAEQSALWGLGRTLALEHPRLHCTLVDLDPGATDHRSEMKSLAQAMLSGAIEGQQAWRAGRRYVPRLTQRPRQGFLPVPEEGDAYRLEIAKRGKLDVLQIVATDVRPPGPGEVQ